MPSPSVLSPFSVLGETTGNLYEEARAYSKALVRKWRPLIDLEGEGIPHIPQRYEGAMAMLFENQVWATIAATEDTLKANVTLPVKWTLPIIRRTYPKLLAMKICSIQPMSRISGGVAQCFYLRFQREVDSSYLSTMKSEWAYNVEKGVPKMGRLILTSESVEATKDILAASWSTEVMEDARGAMNLDVDLEIVNAHSDEIGRELDSRILNEILTGATAGNVNWSQTMAAGYTTMADWLETLGHRVVEAEALIYAQRYEGAHYIVAGTTLYIFLAQMRSFKAKTPGPADAANLPPDTLGAQYVGTWNGLWDIYRSPHITATMGIVGRYPSSIVDAGYIFMPYIPIMKMPLIYAEMDATTGDYSNKDAWTRNIRTRNGKFMAIPRLFSTLTVTA